MIKDKETIIIGSEIAQNPFYEDDIGAGKELLLEIDYRGSEEAYREWLEKQSKAQDKEKQEIIIKM